MSGVNASGHTAIADVRSPGCFAGASDQGYTDDNQHSRGDQKPSAFAGSLECQEAIRSCFWVPA
jgi:hypothetical protein